MPPFGMPPVGRLINWGLAPMPTGAKQNDWNASELRPRLHRPQARAAPVASGLADHRQRPEPKSERLNWRKRGSRHWFGRVPICTKRS